MTFGAEHKDWVWFSERLGLRADLLPVVSNPAAPIAAYSKMKDKGKTPSRYNSEREVHGITKWTEVSASARDISTWARERDYGICIQTREVRAIDIDVADEAAASAIEQAVRDAVPGVHFPKRYRANSGKRVLAFTYGGELTKRSFPVGGERVELLATGQQFVAVGTHPSGARYIWDGGLPEGFPDLTADEVELVWSTIELLFATGLGQIARVSTREARGSALGEDSARGDDEVATYLIDHGYIVDEGAAGQLYVDCPWKEGHSGDSGVTESVYFPAGTGGFDLGHYKCLHASCDGRTDEDFRQAIGFNDDIEFRARDFAALPMVTTLPAIPGLEDGADIERASPLSGRLPIVPADIHPIFRRDAKSMILPTALNVTRAVACAPFITRKLRYDQFRGEVVWAWSDEGDGIEEWRRWTDVDYNRAMCTLDNRQFASTPSIEKVRNAINDVADANPVDTAIKWLGELRWDGQDRCERFLIDYMGCEDTPYSRAVSLYLWTALAGRCMEPGVQADMAVIFVDPRQGTRKTTMVASLVPDRGWFGELDFDLEPADLGRLMRGKLVCELSELKGLASRDAGSIKKFISAREDEWVPKYQEISKPYPRRCVFIGTANETEFLADPTGERRWLPIMTGRGEIDAIVRDRDNLWAEARERFKLGGVAFEDAERLGEAEHAKFKAIDPLQDRVEQWLCTAGLGGYVPGELPHVSLEEVFEQGLGREFTRAGVAEQRRVGRILRALGYSEQRVRLVNGRRRLWVKPVEENNDE